MSFLKKLGNGLGKGSGLVLGGTVKAIGSITGSDFIKEVGDGVEKSMQHTGKLIGDVADGVADVGIGLVSKDQAKAEQGLGNLGSTAKVFGKQVGHSAIAVLEQGVTAIDSLAEGDYEAAKKATKNLAKVAAVSVIAVGLVEAVDGVDSVSSDLASLETNDVTQNGSYIEVENYNTHEVSPHERVLADGRTIWVDGDGDTSINRDTGWIQTNPNYRIPI